MSYSPIKRISVLTSFFILLISNCNAEDVIYGNVNGDVGPGSIVYGNVNGDVKDNSAGSQTFNGGTFINPNFGSIRGNANYGQIYGNQNYTQQFENLDKLFGEIFGDKSFNERTINKTVIPQESDMQSPPRKYKKKAVGP